MSGHSFLSPSGASRWMACTKAPHLEKRFPDRTSAYAEEGTFAHRVAELCLRYYSGQIDKKEWDDMIDNECRPSSLFNAETFGLALDYAEYVTGLSKASNTTVVIEQRVDLSRYIPEGYGHVDAGVINPTKKELHVVDYKFGKGVEVSPVDNPQAKSYAIGLLDKIDPDRMIKNVVLHIYQPRIGNISSWEIPAKALRAWAEEVLAEKAREAFEDRGEFVPGKHCVFCKAKSQCKVFADWNLSVIGTELKDPGLLTSEETAHILERSSSIVAWLTGLKEYALDEALKGAKWPGFKVVEGRSNRVYKSEEEVLKALEASGLTRVVDVYQPARIHGITAMKGALGAKAFASVVEPLLIKPKGSPVLVPESDKREPYRTTAEQAFAEPLEKKPDMVKENPFL